MSEPRLCQFSFPGPVEVGIAQPTISAVLRGTRRLTRDQIVALSRFFHVSPEVFLRT